MTKIYLHGLLGQIFGTYFEFKINSGLSAIRAIASNREDFLKQIKILERDGLFYDLIIDEEAIDSKEKFSEKRNIKSIHILPSIKGYGGIFSGMFGAAGMGLGFFGGILSLILSFFLFKSKTNEVAPPITPAVSASIGVGGATMAIESAGKSYVFSNKLNAAEQASSIPVGFGKFKCASKLIGASMKSYPTNYNPYSEFNLDYQDTLFTDFITP